MIKRLSRKLSAALSLMACTLGASVGSRACAAGIPPVIAESAVKLVAGTTGTAPALPVTFINPTKAAVDASGNIFVVDSARINVPAASPTAANAKTFTATVWEIPAGTTTPVLLYPTPTSTLDLGGNTGLAVDAAGDVIVGQSYNNGVLIFKNVNGVLNTTPAYIGGNSNLGGLDGYYASFVDVAVVNGTQVYASVATANGGASTAIFTFTTAGTGASKYIASLPGGKSAVSMAGDNAGHLYYSDGIGVYAVNTATVPATPVLVATTGIPTAGGVSVDAAGNLYITDTTNSRIVVVPNESGTLNPADQYTVATNVYAPFSPGIDAAGNLYYTDRYRTNSLYKITLGNAAFAATAVGATSPSVTFNFIFNAAVMPASIAYLQGSGSSKDFTASGGTCAAGTAYTAGQSCTVTTLFSPQQAGSRTGAVVLQSAAGKPLGTAYLFGAGNGAAITIDPGTQTTLTGTASPVANYKSPMAQAFDSAGALYTADASLQTVFVTPAGATAATSTVGVGLSIPSGVTVDAAGNLFIADTGNNRIVEVPNEGGVLNTADQVVVLGTGLKAPTAIRASADGMLYVADTGNARVVRIPTFGGFGSATATAIGSGFKVPAGVTTDASGALYVSDSAANQVVRISIVSGVSTVVASQLGAPTAIALDAAGDLYVVNSGSKAVAMIPNVGGTLNTANPQSLGTGLLSPAALAIDGAGNLAIADGGNASVYRLARTQGQVNFGNINIQLQSAAQQVTVTSSGTQPLIFNSPYAVITGVAANFQQQAPANACAAGTTLATGTSCAISEIFAPITINALSETQTLSSNAVNASSPSAVFAGFATNLALTTTTLAQSVPTGSPSFGQTVTVTATVTANRAGYTPTGTVSFFRDGIKVGTSNLLATGPTLTAQFTFSLAAQNQLSAGPHTISASYNGDASNAASSVGTPLSVSLSKSTATATLAVVPTYAVAPGSVLTFNVTLTPPVAFPPSGSVNLYLAGTSTIIGTAPLAGSATGSNAVAVITLPASATQAGGPLQLGQYQLTASYVGDGNFVPAQTSAVGVSVRNTGYDVAISNANLTVKQGQSVSTVLTISSVAGYGGSTFIPASGTTAASVTFDVVAYMCSALPANVTCGFSPGQAYVNSYNVNDPCSLASTPLGASYCTNPNFPNSYQVTLIISTDVKPPTTAGFPGGKIWPLSALVLAWLTLSLRRRYGLGTQSLLAIAFVLLLVSSAGMTGCGSGSTANLSPVGTTAFNVNFQGQNPSGVTLPTINQTLPLQLTITQ